MTVSDRNTPVRASRRLCPLLIALCLSGAGAGCSEPEVQASSTQATLDPDLADGFWSFPFPSDLRVLPQRRAASTAPDYTGFPNPSDNGLLDRYLSTIHTDLDGFGLNSPTTLSFNGMVQLPELSEDAIAASMHCEASVRILNVDPESPEFGRCHPARWHVVPSTNVDPYLQANSVLVAPYWGFPLLEGTTYAVYLFEVEGEDGRLVEGPASLQQALHEEGEGALADLYRPLREALGEQPGLEQPENRRWIASATVFTTQILSREMEQLAAAIREDKDLPRWTGELTALESDHSEFSSDYPIYDGAYVAGNYQSGTPPYASLGGGFVFENEGPAVQMEERVPFAIALPPTSFEQPEEGWPVVLMAHGTGGDRFSHLTGNSGTPARLAGSRGFLSIGIPQPFHGDRWPNGTSTLIDLYSFNYFNPDSGRSTFRQGALDSLSLLEFVVRDLAQGGDVATAFPELRINPDEIYFMGHSQGGLTGALAIPFAQGIKAWVLSGAGGGLSMTILQREDPFVIRDAVLTALNAPDGTELFEMHPLIGVVQALAEATDPINYAPFWVANSTGEPVSVLLTEGMRDAQTPADTSEALAVAGRLPVIQPYEEREIFGLELRDLEPLEAPYSGNLTHPTGSASTTGLAQFDALHWAIFNNPDARLLWANFIWSMRRDGSPGELGGSFP